MMEKNEENPTDMNPENSEEKEKSSQDKEKVLEEIVENGMFSCPECSTQVDADAIICPGCGAVFEPDENIPISSSMEEEQIPSIPGQEDEQPPPPSDYIGGQVSLPETDISSEAPLEDSLSPSDIKRPEILENGQQVKRALAEYNKKRKNQYLFGTIFLGLGIILFVLLWLVTVNQVLVEEAENVFGADIILLLIGAGIFFILGLYLIITYPKSSLVDVFASLPKT